MGSLTVAITLLAAFSVPGDESVVFSAASLGTVEVSNSNSRYCGVHSVVIASRMLGADTTVRDLLDDVNVSSRRGSTIEDIERMISQLRLRYTAVADGTASWLQKLSTPAILHVRGHLDKSNVNHWVVYGGIQNGKFRFVDGSVGEITLSRAELLAMWDGIAVVVQNKSESPLVRFTAQWDENVILLIILTASFFWLAPKPHKVFHFAAFIVVCTLIFLTKPDSFLRNSYATAAARSSIVLRNAVVDEIQFSELRTLMADDGVILVDARTRRQFDDEHMPNALSLPIDSGMLDYLAFARSGTNDKRLVVTYCNGQKCAWAEAAARRLSTLGVRVKVFYGGMDEWQNQKTKL